MLKQHRIFYSLATEFVNEGFYNHNLNIVDVGGGVFSPDCDRNSDAERAALAGARKERAIPVPRNLCLAKLGAYAEKRSGHTRFAAIRARRRRLAAIFFRAWSIFDRIARNRLAGYARSAYG